MGLGWGRKDGNVIITTTRVSSFTFGGIPMPSVDCRVDQFTDSATVNNCPIVKKNIVNSYCQYRHYLVVPPIGRWGLGGVRLGQEGWEGVHVALKCAPIHL